MSKSQYITGLRAVEQILATESTDIRRIYAEYQTANPRVEAVIKMARQNNIEIQPANRARLMQISGESRHQGVVAEVRRSTLLDEAGLRTMVEERLQEGRPILLLVLDGVQDPHNLGACMRTADAAGVDAVIVPRHGAAGLGPTVSKVAAGAAEQLPFVPVGNLGRVLGWLGDYGVRCVRFRGPDHGARAYGTQQGHRKPLRYACQSAHAGRGFQSQRIRRHGHLPLRNRSSAQRHKLAIHPWKSGIYGLQGA
jgi:23S rRNA (guanosine2251-2'-O)-methyltransferase